MSVLLLFAVITASQRKASAPVTELMIRGDWCAGSKNAFHEEFALDVENGVRVFSSWLHQKPALYGTWELKGRTLTVHGENGDLMEYNILSASRTRLVVREKLARHPGHSPRKLDKEQEIYVRSGRCLPVYNPYDDPAFRDSPTPPN